MCGVKYMDDQSHFARSPGCETRQWPKLADDTLAHTDAMPSEPWLKRPSQTVSLDIPDPDAQRQEVQAEIYKVCGVCGVKYIDDQSHFAR